MYLMGGKLYPVSQLKSTVPQDGDKVAEAGGSWSHCIHSQEEERDES